MVSIVNVPMARRSNLIEIYEKLISSDAIEFLEEIGSAGEIYSSIILNSQNDSLSADLKKQLLALEHIQGAPSYTLMLYLFANKKNLKLEDSHLSEIVSFLVNFFVRRNLTDTPPTRNLDRLFMDTINKLNDITDKAVYQVIQDEFSKCSSIDQIFQKN